LRKGSYSGSTVFDLSSYLIHLQTGKVKYDIGHFSYGSKSIRFWRARDVPGVTPKITRLARRFEQRLLDYFTLPVFQFRLKIRGSSVRVRDRRATSDPQPQYLEKPYLSSFRFYAAVIF
jgi:hypothetical protein